MDVFYCSLIFGLITYVSARDASRASAGLVSTARYLETNEIEDESCLTAMERVYTDHVMSPHPPNLSGDWTSAKCEIRPGPEFVLRHYKFNEDNEFELHQYYYKDSSCTEPGYSIVAKGELNIGDKSWLVPGGLDAEYSLSEITVMPYSTHVARKLQENFSRHCPQMVRENWRAHNSYTLFQFLLDPTHDFEDEDEDADILVDHDCRSALNLVFHELQLVRMEVRRRGLVIQKQLLFGDIHTDYTQRATYRPTSYQDPLYFVQTGNCPVCSHILNARRDEPPKLFKKSPPDNGLLGEWFSERCEIRPVGQFLTRHFMFNVDKKSWEGYFHYFSDGQCLKPLFTVHATGSYLIGKRSADISGAFKFDVRITKMAVTPLDSRIVNLMNEDLGDNVCGDVGSWSRGIAQEVTSTGGCAMLGLRVPVLAFELLRLERDHHKTLLYLGQGQTVSTQGQTQGHDTHHEPMRSTSFQAPLVRCGSVQNTRKAIFETAALQDGGSGPINVNIQAQVSPLENSKSSASQIQLSFISAFICIIFALIV